MADVTGGDLYSLWKIANVSLPRVASVYTSTSGTMNGGQDGMSDLFLQGEGQYGQPMYGAAYASFQKTYSEFQHILAQTGQNILDTAAAVNLAIQNFGTADGETGTTLDDLNAILEGEQIGGTQYHDPNDPTMNPPEDPPGEVTEPEGYTSPGDEPAEDPGAEEQEIQDTIDDLNEMAED
ncbi:hypothetical protein LX16_4308 [Stackebrandtia albiflava]|uniref:Uncharacterized protein n=1 Tax=Stackebrandtia albiflava TaxID=406432 RepID=A0A562UR70_9ACTN|nr:hypothetical protein [Stackebrandtia albiflava]TWJ08088.1 hypothetical protein LX16_4308 [Stackebrandtia albiflava]